MEILWLSGANGLYRSIILEIQQLISYPGQPKKFPDEK